MKKFKNSRLSIDFRKLQTLALKYPLNGHARNVRGKTQTRIRQAFVHYFSFFVVVVVEPAILAWEKIAES